MFMINISLLVRIMKLTHRKRKASKFAPQDFISSMPDNVVTNILDRLPVRHAVRTSILSRSWRFKWTMLSQLEFDRVFFGCLMQHKGENDCGGVISRLLLHIEGVIEKFVLSMFDVKHINYRVENINHWILFLSTKRIKDLTLDIGNWTPVKMPTHLFSCVELKHLKLRNCSFNPPSTFHGFPNLLSLELYMVRFKSGELGEILTRCPLLETLDLGYLYSTRSVKLVEIAKSENLKTLSLRLCDLDTETIISSSTIFELVGFLPKLEELSLDFAKCQLTEAGAKKKFPTASLKTLTLSRIDLSNVHMRSCVFEVIRNFPNLQTLIISSIYRKTDSVPIPEEYNTTGLRRVVFECLEGSENEVYLIKYLLLCSPFLEKVVIRGGEWFMSRKRLKFARKVLKLHRASTVAEIDFK
ncbi:putative F-box domain, leucine-rich repeat domain superfamily, F-box-like domain superfamily [Helianthus annuus]|uniref:F-box domain, leucine-rich repeat domain superfamily, F-box-like domain superfamily n=2 Tax=Helianthus annuus TaxID=4232 RepID=A0A251S2P9_HELAN|nr:putative F-box domain, leucine-rich repeat domain superfamily, F-box-like domain superfamily [Helianthus annuus]